MINKINFKNKIILWFKADIARWNIIFLILFTIILVLINLLLQTIGIAPNIYEPVSKGGGNIWPIWLSLFSAFFGMLNVCTYSLMKINDLVKRNHYKIFIVFNSLAVISLAIINFKFGLYILWIENILFFFTGCFQYYMWFIKDHKLKKEKFIFKRFSYNDLYLFVFVFFTIFLFIFIRLYFMEKTGKLIPGGTHEGLNGTLITNHVLYYYIRAVIDPILGAGGLLGAFMIAKRKFLSVYIYWVSNFLLMLMWVILLLIFLFPATNTLAQDESITLLTSLNMIVLFTFYFLSNFFNYYKWKPNLEDTSKLKKENQYDLDK